VKQTLGFKEETLWNPKMQVINNEVYYNSCWWHSMSDISACHWTQLTSPPPAGQDLPLLSGAFRQPSGGPDSHMGAIREQQKQVKVLVAIRDIVAVQITTTNIFHFTHFNYCSLHGSHTTARLRSSMKVTHITSLVLSPAPLLTLTHAHILKT